MEALNHFENIRSLDARAVKDALYRVRGNPVTWAGYAAAGVAFAFLDAAVSAVQVQVWSTWLDWYAYANCMHRVIAPRFEASTARGRIQVHARGEWIDIPYARGEYDLTAMMRPVARENVLELDVVALFAENRDFVFPFDEVYQSQPIGARMCHGVVIPPDPNALHELQEAHSLYFVGDETDGNRYVSHW